MSKSWVCKDPMDRMLHEMELLHKFKNYQYFLIGYQDGYFDHVNQKDYDEAVDFIVTHIDRLRWIRTE